MSVIGTAKELPDSPQANQDLGQQTYVRKFLVVTDDVMDGPIQVCLAPGLPILFEPYIFGSEFHPYALLRTNHAERLAPGSLEWVVTSTYSTPPLKDPSVGDGPGGPGGAGGDRSGSDGSPGGGGGTGVEDPASFLNPLLEVPVIETHFSTQKVPMYGQWFNGVYSPVAASNDELYVPPPQKDESWLVMTITRNEPISAPHPKLACLYMDCINSDTFWGCSAGQVKIAGITVNRLTRQLPDQTNFAYLRVCYTFHFKDTWDIKVLDYGTYYLDSSNNQQSFMTMQRNPLDRGLLDGAGGELPVKTAPVYNTVTAYQSLPFAALNLPQSFSGVQ